MGRERPFDTCTQRDARGCVTGVVVIASPVEVCFCANDNAASDEMVVVTDLATAQEIDAIVRGVGCGTDN